MRVLWITNIMLPPICKYLRLDIPVVGGWMYSSAKSLLGVSNELQLAVATIYSGKKMIFREVDGISYYLLPTQKDNTKYQKSLEKYWQQINNEFQPDLVHLHGTEFAHGLAFLRACPNVKSVVSIQGLVSVIAKYYLAGIRVRDIIRNITFHDLIRGSLFKQQKSFQRRGKIEVQIIKNASYIIGRTEWDKVHTLAINPSAKYFSCNETLRESFYKNQWQYDKCDPHSIFVSQAGYPIKGLHQLLRALPLILRSYPDTKIYVAGSDMIDTSSLSKKLRFTGYGGVIKFYIKSQKLENHVVFTGPLDEKQICERYLRSNVFVCPSAIENSPNSLGEAQLLGMPCIASYVGGIPDMMYGNERWLYRFEEIEMLAKKVCEIFEISPSFDNSYMRDIALKRHNELENANKICDIYKYIKKDN